MREIKFRAWDKTRNEMFCYSNQSGIKQLNFIQDMSVDSIELFEYLPNESFVFKTLSISDVVLMQYTGLRDKLGVEIYEGDIVKIGINFGFGIEDLFGEVIFKDCTFIYRNESQGDTGLYGIDSNNLCEVVGNIYENKELLQ